MISRPDTGRIRPPQDIHQVLFPEPEGPHDGNKLSALYLDIDIHQRTNLGIPLPKVIEISWASMIFTCPFIMWSPQYRWSRTSPISAQIKLPHNRYLPTQFPQCEPSFRRSLQQRPNTDRQLRAELQRHQDGIHSRAFNDIYRLASEPIGREAICARLSSSRSTWPKIRLRTPPLLVIKGST